MKELRVFVVSSFSIFMDGVQIDIWDDTPEGQELPKEAKEFIKIAEDQGRVYSLKGFMSAFNIAEDITPSDWIFITNKY